MQYRALFALFCCMLCGAALAQSYPTPQFYQAPLNLELNVSVASNELTIAINDPNGNVPATSHPVLLNFRSATVSSGAITFVPVTAATAFTTGAITDSMGCTTAVLCRLWVWAIDNAGTADICVYNAEAAGRTIVDLNEAVLQSSASGTGGGTSAQTLYCNASSVSSKAVRRLGYVDATWTSGTGWSGPTTVQLFGPGIHKPGEVVQGPFFATNSTNYAVTTSFGVTSIVQTITPTSAVDLIYATADVNVFQTGSSDTVSLQIGRGSCATQFGTFGILENPIYAVVPLSGMDAPASTSSLTYGVCATSNVGGNAAVNPALTGIESSITVWEIMGALDGPANDNVNPGVFARVG